MNGIAKQKFKKIDADVNEDLPAGAFAKSGTEVPAKLIVIQKTLE